MNLSVRSTNTADEPKPSALEVAFEPHFKCKELAARWGMSVTTVTNLFADEPGVVKIGGRSSRKRTKVSLFVPLSVAERVYATLSVKAA